MKNSLTVIVFLSLSSFVAFAQTPVPAPNPSPSSSPCCIDGAKPKIWSAGLGKPVANTEFTTLKFGTSDTCGVKKVRVPSDNAHMPDGTQEQDLNCAKFKYFEVVAKLERRAKKNSTELSITATDCDQKEDYLSGYGTVCKNDSHEATCKFRANYDPDGGKFEWERVQITPLGCE